MKSFIKFNDSISSDIKVTKFGGSLIYDEGIQFNAKKVYSHEKHDPNTKKRFD
jgi:hypothetical protein